MATSNEKWVQWDVAKNTVGLRSSLWDFCLVNPDSLPERGPNVFRVFVQRSELTTHIQLNHQRKREARRILFATTEISGMSGPFVSLQASILSLVVKRSSFNIVQSFRSGIGACELVWR